MDENRVYRIEVAGRLDESWARWFEGLAMAFTDDATIFSGPMVDQAALRGVLNKMWDLNLVIRSVTRVE
ncbi:MAG: hypothetical protein JXD18_11105 [Anaerolineae bacterium]|nr:hypothetical protein [Anaerolineae bacterium]